MTEVWYGVRCDLRYSCRGLNPGARYRWCAGVRASSSVGETHEIAATQRSAQAVAGEATGSATIKSAGAIVRFMMGLLADSRPSESSKLRNRREIPPEMQKWDDWTQSGTAHCTNVCMHTIAKHESLIADLAEVTAGDPCARGLHGNDLCTGLRTRTSTTTGTHEYISRCIAARTVTSARAPSRATSSDLVWLRAVKYHHLRRRRPCRCRLCPSGSRHRLCPRPCSAPRRLGPSSLPPQAKPRRG